MIEYVGDKKELYYRLIALWVVCEAFAGGIMHAAKIPFTGMFVSGLAVSCIIFIAYYVPSKTNIIKATIIVAVFKLMLSPHAPPTAYIAMFFQGLMGQWLFRSHRFFKLSAILLAVLALTESALQRLLVLLLVYGKSFWHAADEYLNKLTGGGDLNYSLWFAGIYILIHGFVGLFIGIFSTRLAKSANEWRTRQPNLVIKEENINAEVTAKPRKRKKIKIVFLLIWLALIIAFMQAYFDPKYAILPANEIGRILMRSALIVLSWSLIIAPLVMFFLKKGINSLKEKQHLPVKRIMELLPRIKYIFIQSWLLSASLKGFRRLKLFAKIVSVNILSGDTTH